MVKTLLRIGLFFVMGLIMSYFWPCYLSFWDAEPREGRNMSSLIDNLTQGDWILPADADSSANSHPLYEAQS